jgi:hypothetical protein
MTDVNYHGLSIVNALDNPINRRMLFKEFSQHQLSLELPKQ